MPFLCSLIKLHSFRLCYFSLKFTIHVNHEMLSLKKKNSHEEFLFQYVD